HPFPGADSRARTAAVQAYGDGRAPLRLAAELPAEWRPIVADCLARDHAARLPHTAASILARIPERRRRRRRGPALVAAGAVATAVAAFVLVPGGSGETGGVPVTVFNAETSCRYSPSDGCRLGLAGDPYAKYGAA